MRTQAVASRQKRSRRAPRRAISGSDKGVRVSSARLEGAGLGSVDAGCRRLATPRRNRPRRARARAPRACARRHVSSTSGVASLRVRGHSAPQGRAHAQRLAISRRMRTHAPRARCSGRHGDVSRCARVRLHSPPRRCVRRGRRGGAGGRRQRQPSAWRDGKLTSRQQRTRRLVRRRVAKAHGGRGVMPPLRAAAAAGRRAHDEGRGARHSGRAAARARRCCVPGRRHGSRSRAARVRHTRSGSGAKRFCPATSARRASPACEAGAPFRQPGRCGAAGGVARPRRLVIQINIKLHVPRGAQRCAHGSRCVTSGEQP